MFKANESQIYLIANRTLSSLSIVLLVIIAYQFTHSFAIAMVTFALLMMNLQTSQFDITLNPEAFAAFLLIVYIYAVTHVRHESFLYTVSLFFLISLLIFTKPIFIYLIPISYIFLICTAPKKTNTIVITISTVVSIGFLLFYSFLNGVFYNHAALSSVSSINLAGKLLQYNLAQYGPTHQKYQPVKSTLLATGEYQDIYWRLPILYRQTPKEISPFTLLSEYSTLTILHKLPQYALASINEVIPIITSIPMSFNTNNGIYISGLSSTHLTRAYSHTYDSIFSLIKQYIYHGMMITTLLNVIAIIIFNDKLSIKLLFINSVLWSHILIMSVTAYSEYARIQSPITNLLLVYILVVFYVFLKHLKRLSRPLYVL